MASWMLRVETIVQQLSNIDNGKFAIGEFHEPYIVDTLAFGYQVCSYQDKY